MLVNVFPYASLKGFIATNAFFGLKIQIETARNSKGKMRKPSKAFTKLMYGSFILFSSDNFQNEIYSAVVKERDEK